MWGKLSSFAGAGSGSGSSGGSNSNIHAYLDAAKNGKWSYVENWLSASPSNALRINDAPGGRWPALHQAAWWMNKKAVSMLLEKGADPTAVNQKGQTAADVARENGDLRLGAKLKAAENEWRKRGGKRKGGKVSAPAAPPPQSASTSTEEFLDHAKAGRWDEAIAWLSASPENLARISDAPRGRWTALHQAAWWRNPDVARTLLGKGADPTVRNRDGHTPADVARHRGDMGLGNMLGSEEARWKGGNHTARWREGGRRDKDGGIGSIVSKERIGSGLDNDRGPRGKMDLIVGNTVRELSQRKGPSVWQWQLFLGVQPSSSLATIDSVKMHLHETFNPNVVDLSRDEANGRFISHKITGWGTFEILLHVRVSGLGEPILVRHYLSFDEGGASRKVSLDLGEIKEQESCTAELSNQREQTRIIAGAVAAAAVARQTVKKSETEEKAIVPSNLGTKGLHVEEEEGSSAIGVPDSAPTSLNPYLLGQHTLLGRLDFIVGNTAEELNLRKRWQIFLESQPSSSSTSIDSVTMHLRETFDPYVVDLSRDGAKWGRFVSPKMTEWDTLEIMLHVQVRGLRDPVLIRHRLGFEDGGVKRQISLDLDEIRAQEFFVTRNKNQRIHAQIRAEGPKPAKGADTQQQALLPSNQDIDGQRFDTRTSLEVAIAKCNEDILYVKNGGSISMDALRKAEIARRELDRLIPLRKDLPSLDDLKQQLQKIEEQQATEIRKENFSAAMDAQRKMDELTKKIKNETAGSAVKNSRIKMQSIIDSDMDPHPVSMEYLEECTDGFSEGRKIGEGAFSHVYLGKDQVLRRKFAVKRLKLQALLHGNMDVKLARKTFERELMTLKQYKHPNIARLYAFSLSPDLRNGHQCLVFELAANGSLHAFLKHQGEKGKLHWTNRINIALDIAKALDFLHKGNCFHRDVKSSNICLRRDFTALLIDCGVAKIVPDKDSDSTMTIMESTAAGVRGTPGYICPMLFSSVSECTSANEVFSLGMVFIELFTGLLQNSRVDENKIDLFCRYSKDGVENRELVADADIRSGDWDKDIQGKFAEIAVECVHLHPGNRPGIQEIVQKLEKLSSQARCWSPGEKNRIQVLTSAPLVWTDVEGDLHPISSLDHLLERDLLVQCVRESKKGIDLSFDVATYDRLQAVVTRRCGCLHFSGHGSPDYLIFEDGVGGAHFLGEQELLDCVHAEPFKFVFVSACHSSIMGHAFVQAGVPHVVCCDYEEKIRDDAALNFTRSFYLALAEGYTVLAAFEKGRQMVSAKFDQDEMSKYLLLPENGDHDEPIFDVNVIEWEDCPKRERFIPIPPHPFVGREADMYKILCKVLSNRLVTLIGQEGIGCSSLAAAISHYIHQRKTTILNIEDIYFISKGDETQKCTGEGYIMSLYGQLESEGCVGNLEKGKAFKDVLSNISEGLAQRKALLVFDGVPSKDETFYTSISHLMEKTNLLKVLVTTKNPIGLSLTNVEEEIYEVFPLDAESTFELFANKCPHVDTPMKEEALVDMLMKNHNEAIAEYEHQDDRIKTLGGGIPSCTIQLAKEMTKEEFEKLSNC